MSIDALTVTAILVIFVLIGVMVRICTLADNGCSGPNEYLSRPREADRKDGSAE